MRGQSKVAVLIPALNEEHTIGEVIDKTPSFVDRIIVADNGSTDRTREIAASRGAIVVVEPRRGYGSACLAAMRELERHIDPRTRQIVVFLDGDLADDPTEMSALVDPIVQDTCDMVIGSRLRGTREPGALTLTQRFGNWLSCRLIGVFYNVTYSDLGPFRAIDWRALTRLGMNDRGYGWTVQMQIRAARHRLRTTEVPVSYRRRKQGVSKISGTMRGIIGAGTTILFVIFAEVFR